MTKLTESKYATLILFISFINCEDKTYARLRIGYIFRVFAISLATVL